MRSIRGARIERGVIHLRKSAVAGREKLGELARRDRFGRRQVQPQRFEIAIDSVIQDAEVEMRAGGKACHAHKPYPVARLNVLADMHENSRKMHVHRFVAVQVLNLHKISSTTLWPREHHKPRWGGCQMPSHYLVVDRGS